MKINIHIIFILLSLIGCKSTNKVAQTNHEDSTQFTPKYEPGPHLLIYKTRNNYENLVPVILSDDKTEIISYPHPTDLKIENKYPLPTNLDNGYLLDNRGISKNVAFLKLTYQEYSELKSNPTLTELYSYIIDKDPITELCDCGNKTTFTDIVKLLNSIINNQKLRTTCKPIK